MCVYIVYSCLWGAMGVKLKINQIETAKVVSFPQLAPLLVLGAKMIASKTNFLFQLSGGKAQVIKGTELLNGVYYNNRGFKHE